MSRFTATALLLVGATALASAQSRTFTVVSGLDGQLAQVESKTAVETFTGKTKKVSGSIVFDAKKKTGRGKIMVEAADLNTGIPLRDEHLREDRWLDTGKHPQITFTTTKVQHLKGDTYRVTGNFTLKGVTKPMTVEASVKTMKASEQTKKAGFKGDVVQLRTSFNVKLADHNVVIAGQAVGKVSETVRISITAYGQAG
jgi:polyisoprenoid-binding protein YceI